MSDETLKLDLLAMVDRLASCGYNANEHDENAPVLLHGMQIL